MTDPEHLHSRTGAGTGTVPGPSGILGRVPDPAGAPTPFPAAAALAGAVAAGDLDLPLPGSGATAERWARLDVVDCTSWRFAGAVTLLPAGPARFSVLIVGRPQRGDELAFARVTDLAEIGIESGEYDPGSVTGRRNAAMAASGIDDAAVAEYRRLSTHR
ncbi:hypothetical protein Ae168Ps1_1778 [Pseudonocardia sp. Ae168_Ps1]|uniref:hypothetical protein n=1 Tax=unclassified Pseudonocardia TaxID=2619320 RepID=UPI00094B606A|nr:MULTISPECIES: hypothetical protein [unclassified Pseudonocardia]OLL73396.1 hypothetical protein Ae150APs1_1774 [Pseudonocardia sp. Ae150A_Ps1]OLL79372.1 hypothetical protein Ae168Ps1_1778 [Pseudonocardia sp. Ae168_Ps1]OLL86493.1 hypothetical protein Ae263Ps1_3548c [Pseudonocardia sp. Ae263_Ps1]OLL93458.1 hypothetical protein Ae356Ps1_3355 [Pseudonocardia sp. Ae356_Ps1]